MATTVYITRDELKTQLTIALDNTTFDDELDARSNAASRRVDKDTGRRFWLDDEPIPRVFKPTHPELLIVPDISSSVDLVVEEGAGDSWTVVDPSQYEVLPENADADGVAIEFLRRRVGAWPVGTDRRVRITPRAWGWLLVPADIHDATLLLATRLRRRKESPDGVLGGDQYGTIRVSRYDPDYDALIGPYVRDEV